MSDTARLDAELLMAGAVGVTRSQLLIRHMDKAVPETFDVWVARRERHEPIAYILGTQEFFGRTFTVTPDVLIPRSDSEVVVETLLEIIAGRATGRIIDLGTGSGALLLTALAKLPNFDGIGVDRSRAALNVARGNAESLGLRARCEFKQWDWHQDSDWSATLGLCNFVIANPPYVNSDAVLDPDVQNFEPSGALFAGPDGLDDYRAIIPQLRSLGAQASVLEIGATQAEQVTALAEANGFTVELRNDLANRPRALVLR